MPKYASPTAYAGKKATKNVSGQARFANDTEAAAGTDEGLIISPATLASAVDDLVPTASTTQAGIIEIATDAEATAGVSTTLAMTPHTVGLIAIAGAPNASEVLAGIAELATTAETTAYTDDARIVTPLKLGSAFAAPPALGSGTPAAGSFTTLAATGAIDFDAGGSFESGGAAIDIGADASADAINIGTGAAARVITIGNVTGATQVVLNAGTAGIALASTGAGDITINSDDTLLLDADGVLELNSSAGVIGIGNDADANNINIGTGAAARVITVGNGTGASQVVIDAGTAGVTVGANAIAQPIVIGNQTGASSVVIDSGTGAINVGTSIAKTITIGNVTGGTAVAVNVGTGNFALDGVAASTYNIGASTTTGTITIGGTAQTGTLSIGDSSGTMTLELGAGEGATTVAIAGGATNPNTVNIATGAVANVVTIGTVSGAASLDLLCGTGNFTLEGNVASTYDISNTGVNTGTVSIAGGTGARTINLGGGGTGAKTINIGAAASADVITIGTSTGAGSLDLACGTGNFTLEGDVASTYEISSTGANTGTCKFASGTGARTVEIGGGGTGVKTINIGAAATADVITIGTTTGAGSLTLAAGTGDITISGTVKEIDAEFLFSSGTDLTITQSPIVQSNATTGAAPTGSNGDVNLLYMQDGCLMEQFIIGTQTIIAPRMSSNGLAIELDNTNAEGAEYNFGARNNAKHAYTIGTSAAFFVEATFTVVDISGCAPLMVGFRKVEANNATLGSYTDYFCAGLNAATSATNVVLLDELNGGGQTATDSTDAWTGGDTGTTTIRVLVSASGVCTYTIDGGAPSATNAMTFDNADVVMPFIHFVNGADVAGEVALSAFKCGFQA